MRHILRICTMSLMTVCSYLQVLGAQEVTQQVVGTVEGLHGQHLQIRTTEGNLVAVQLDPDTRYEQEGKSAGPGNLRAGVRVVVEAENLSGSLRATLVRIGVRTPADVQSHEDHRTPHDHYGSADVDHLEAHPKPLGIGEAREASGTAWQPDATPMHAVHTMHGRWTLMTHGSGFFGYDYQGSDRGDEQFLSVNWLMFMATHELAGGRVGVRTMLSLEPLTVGEDGYPLLLQTGESFEGQPLHDRQHPHDLFMEVAFDYQRALTERLGFQLYAAPAGEPALGPPAFPHRLSASPDPFAPLGHHWQDSSHITFGVLTAGLFTKSMKVEGSYFNGREPDEERYDFDFREFDSFSGRVALNPRANLSLQASYGFLNSPEALEPETSLHRLTVSAIYHRPFRTRGFWATTGVWGRNEESAEDATDAFLIESNLDLDGRNAIFSRLELVEKAGGDLVLPAPQGNQIFDIGSIVLGYLHEWPLRSVMLGLGGRGALNVLPDDLRPFYDTRSPAGAMVFVRVRPTRMVMSPEGTGMHH